MIARKNRMATFCLLATFAVMFAGCGSGGGYESPQVVFDAAQAAANKKDWKALCGCITPESRDKMAGGIAFAGAMLQQFAALGGEEGKKKAAKIKSVLEKHGLTETLKAMNSSPVGPEEMTKKLLKLIKDRDAFLADMLTAMDDGNTSSNMPFAGKATLKDVKIDGDSATGTVVFKKDDGEKSDTMAFKKVEGSWKMDMMK